MSNEISYYKVSCVVLGVEHPGAIINMDHEPQVGDELKFDGCVFKVNEVMELMPPMGNFAFLHATCEYLRDYDEN